MAKQIFVTIFFLQSVLFTFGQTEYTEKTNSKDSISEECCDPAPHPAEPEMVFVEGGVFMMGCTNEQSECGHNESPAHQMMIGNFYMGKYEITQGQWKSLMLNNPSNFLNGDHYPVENVSWEDIQVFIIRLNAATGKQYRLPTEAEWEYVARGGNKTHGHKYSGSDVVTEVAWFWSNSQNSTHPVASKMPNELGIFDMSGNVGEWCNDLYTSYLTKEQILPVKSSTDLYVIRGGRWSSATRACRVSCRDNAPSKYHHPDVGFRLVLMP